MAKIFTKLNIGDTIATNGIRVFKKLVLEVSKVHTFAQFICTLMGFSRVNVDYPVPNQMSTDGQLGVKGTPNAQNVDNIIVTTGEFGSNVTAEYADGINRTGIAEMKFVVCGRPTNGSIEYTRATDEWALGLFGSADYANTVERSGETTVSIETKVMPTEQEMTTMLFSAKGELNGTATPEEAEVAEQVSPHVSAELNMTAQPNVKNMYDVIFVVNGKVEHPTSVLEGEAPSDPVADGTIDKPTKESTAQYHFHYAGWSKTEDGEPISGISEIEILSKTTYTGFAPDQTYNNLYMYHVNPAPFTLSLGKTYKVTWDDVVCECSAQDFSSLIEGTIGLIGYGENGNSEPLFMIGWSSVGVSYVSLDTKTFHTVTINELVESYEGLPIITEDTTFYAVYDEELRHYTVSFYVNGELQSTQIVPYGGVAVPPDVTVEAGMVLQWPEDLTIYGDSVFDGIITRDYIISGEYTFTYDTNTKTHEARVIANKVPVYTVGATYIIEWNGEKFICTAYKASGRFSGTTTNFTTEVIGNVEQMGKVWGVGADWITHNSNNEPFALVSAGDTSNEVYIRTLDNVGTISVNVYAKQ